MIDVRTEKDIERLRQVAVLLDSEVHRQTAVISTLRAQMARLQGEDRSQLELEIQFLQEQLRAREKALFGSSSEKRPPDEKGEEAPEQKKSKRGHGPREQPDLPHAEQEHDLDQADQSCPVCGGQLEEIPGQFEESEQIDVVELTYKVVRHKRKKYRCRCGECVETALGPPKLVPGGRYSVSFATHVAVGKYADHLPLARQVKRMARSGLVVTSQTLWDQLKALGGHLEPTYRRLGEYVLESPVIGADETTWPMMKKGETKKWYVWTVSCRDAVFHRILPSRSHDAAGQVLGDYQGIVMADGYAAYDTLRKKLAGRARAGPTFDLAYCWAHVRRKFIECESDYPQARQIVDLIRKLYRVEVEAKEAPREQRLVVLARLRNEKSRAVVAEIWAKLGGYVALPRSSFGKAIGYALGLKEGLERFLEDPRIPVDNNATERALRGPVVGRKNHYGSRSRRGTEVSAILYSLIETAKLAGLEPSAYLEVAARRAIVAPRTTTLPADLIGEAAEAGMAPADYVARLDPKNPFVVNT